MLWRNVTNLLCGVTKRNYFPPEHEDMPAQKHVFYYNAIDFPSTRVSLTPLKLAAFLFFLEAVTANS
jgi:hypothetical protein